MSKDDKTLALAEGGKKKIKFLGVKKFIFFFIAGFFIVESWEF